MKTTTIFIPYTMESTLVIPEISHVRPFTKRTINGPNNVVYVSMESKHSRFVRVVSFITFWQCEDVAYIMEQESVCIQAYIEQTALTRALVITESPTYIVECELSAMVGGQFKVVEGSRGYSPEGIAMFSLEENEEPSIARKMFEMV